jgi:hypothetical protein
MSRPLSRKSSACEVSQATAGRGTIAFGRQRLKNALEAPEARLVDHPHRRATSRRGNHQRFAPPVSGGVELLEAPRPRDPSKDGCPVLDLVLKFKMLVLQVLHGLL